MNTKRWLALFLVLSFSYSLKSQQSDTLRLMVYNLLNYRNTTNQCTNSNNSPTVKENALEIIIDHVLPDVLVCNELGASPNGFNAFTLMNSSLNKNGRTYYQMANYTSGFQSITNMLYYNSNKLVLKEQSTITRDISNINLVRLIDIYTLYYNDPNLGQHQDTTFLHFIAAHLKAGNTAADRNERALATEAVMAHLDTINAKGNYFFMGDLNVYRATEPCFLDLVAYTPDPSLNFYDPVNRIGNWSNTSSFADVHTQSTRSSGNGCASGGGMDDRFDFILASDEVINDSDKVEYIPNTYTAVGQDGNRFNGSIDSPTNTTAPFFVINALRDLSDHLPVTMDLKVTLPLSTSIESMSIENALSYNSIMTDVLRFSVADSKVEIERVELYSSTAQKVKEFIPQPSLMNEWNVSDLKRGAYFMKLRLKNGGERVQKLIKI